MRTSATSDPRDHTKDKHADKVREQRTVVVKGLGKHVTMSAVCAHLEQAGSLGEVQRVRSTAFVTFTTQRQASWAVERLNNLDLQGVSLQVFLLGGPGWAGQSMADSEIGVSSAPPPLPASTPAAAASVPEPSKVAMTHVKVSLDSAKRRGTGGTDDTDDELKTGMGFTGGTPHSTWLHATMLIHNHLLLFHQLLLLLSPFLLLSPPHDTV